MHFIHNTFKTIQFSVYFTAEDDLKTRAYRNVLPNILTKTNDQYQTKLTLNEHLEHLYGAYFRQKIEKFGNMSVMSITLTIPDPQIVRDPQLFDQALTLFKSTIFNRNIISEDAFLEDKRNYLEFFEGIKERKRQYAQFKFYEHFFKGDIDGYPLERKISAIKKMTFKGLQNYYHSLFIDNRMEIIVNGHLNEDMKLKIKQAFNEQPEHPYHMITEFRKPNPVQTIREKMDTKQAIIMIGYILPIFIKDELYEASMLLDTILGETPESRLFQKIREEKGLCYDVSSSYDPYKGVLTVHSGVSLEQKEEALNAMIELIDDVKTNYITQEELENAKFYYAHLLKSNSDSQSTLTRRLFMNLLLNDFSTLDDRLDRISKVTLEDVKKVIDQLKLDTIYMLEDNHD